MVNIAKNSEQKGIYGHRKLINGDQFQKWAIQNGFSKPLESDDFHCTVAYSRNKDFDTNNIYGTSNKDQIIVPLRNAKVMPLGKDGAIVLKFDSPELHKTWKQCISRGANWDYDGYTPHVTITYNNGKGIDLNNVKLPDFDLAFHKVEFSPIDEEYTADKNSYDVKDPFIIDEATGIKRPKHILPKEKPIGVLPHIATKNSYSDIKKVSLDPKDWFLTQSSIMACLPVPNDNKIPLELVNYVNSNFNTYPSNEIENYVYDFRNSLLLKNHDPALAYGFTIDVKPREVKVGNLTLTYIDILTAVNRNIDMEFANNIEKKKIKFMSWGHTSGEHYCSICNDDQGECVHFMQMLMRDTPRPAVIGDRPYGIIHRYNKDFHVYDVSYLDVRPAYDGAITNSVTLLDKPLIVNVSKEALMEKAIYATKYEEDLKPEDVISKLLSELGLNS